MEQVKNKKILDVENLKVYFYTKKGVSKAVDGNNFKMYENETLAIVGESGCGKSVTAMSILGLVDEPGKIGEDSKIMYGDKNLATLKDDEIRKIRGNDISMIFQEPMTSLNPVFTVGNQIMENILLHEDVKKEEAHERCQASGHGWNFPPGKGCGQLPASAFRWYASACYDRYGACM